MRKLSFIILTLILSMLIPIHLVKADSWVEVARFEGKGYRTGLFTCEYPEWRIKWELTASHEAFHFPHMLKFSVTTIAQDNPLGDYHSQGQEDYVINRIEPIQYAKSGIEIINDHVGTFYILIESNYLVVGYTIVIEQNIDSIPEFPSWVILPLFLVVTFVSILAKKRLLQNTS